MKKAQVTPSKMMRCPMSKSKKQMKIHDRIRAARIAAGLTQEALSTRSGIPLSSYRKYEKGTEPGVEAVSGLARAGIAPNWLLIGEGPMFLEDYENGPLGTKESSFSKYKTSRSSFDENFRPVRSNNLAKDESIRFSNKILREIGGTNEGVFLTRIDGDAMYPTIQNGWIVLIDSNQTEVNSGIYVFRQNDQEMCKRLEKLPNGVVRVISDNKAYPDYDIDPDQFQCEIIGKVIWVSGVLR